MDSQEKCKTWVGNMCKKVGTLYAGIDNIISLESFEYAENQLLTAGANVKQFTETQFLTAGTNVKQFCSEFVEEILPEFLKDSLQEKTLFLEETGKDGISSCEMLKKDEDEGHKDELSKFNSCDGIHASEASIVGKEERLEQNHIMVTLFPSDVLQEENAIGMKPSVCGVDQSHGGGIEDQTDFGSPNSVLCQPTSSENAVAAAEPEDVKVDSLSFHQFSTVSVGFEVPSSGISLSKALNDSTDGPGDDKPDRTKKNDVSLTSMNVTDPLNTMTNDHDCFILARKEICSSPDMAQAMNNFPLKANFEKEWEFIQRAGSQDHDQPQGKSLKRSLQPGEPKSNNSHDFRESEWEII